MPENLDITKPFRGQDLCGLHFQSLIVKSFAGVFISKNGKPIPFWKCECECGGTAVVRGSYLKSGHTTSCGCQKGSLKHGHARFGNRHPLYSMWAGMLQRCKNPNNTAYHNYGGRGIHIDDRWLEFENFLDDMGKTWKPGLTIERTNVDGDYCKSNCTWIPREAQLNNKRNNVVISYEGRTMNATQWSTIVGISRGTLYHRIKSGWSPEKALTTPVA